MPAVTALAPSGSVHVATTQPAPAKSPRAVSALELTRYIDEAFGIDYPSTWRVRPPLTSEASNTTFYLDHPDDGVAVTVLSPAVVYGRARASVVTSILAQQLRKLHPDFRFTQVMTTMDEGAREEAAVIARWTNRWGQPMRGKGRLLSIADGAQTTYTYVSGQAQDVIFPDLEPTIEHILKSFHASFQTTR